MVWVPNTGPQQQAYFCEADELFYGGQAGGGKTDLLIGLALTSHHDSLILRRVNDDAKDIAKRARGIAGPGHGYNGVDKILRLDDRTVRFAGCQHEDDKERFKGRAKDFYGFDEIGDFTRSQFKFITAWNRSARDGQRCRVVAAGNPPTRPEGLWVLQYWAAWLDPRHSRPAKPGELRWYTTDDDGNEIEVEGRGPHVLPNCVLPVYARSRTFIPAKLSDNPDLAKTDYQASLDSLDPAIRSAYRDGNFLAELKDDDWQLIPTAWVLAAMDRWTEDGHKDFTMTAMAVDNSGGGDATAIAWRHRGWYAPLVSIKGKETKDGNAMAGYVVRYRRDNCPVVVDAGGGFSGAMALRLKDNGIACVVFNFAGEAKGRTRDAAKLTFANARAEAYWRFREELNPEQEGGSVIGLPPDDELKADLCAVHYSVSARGILIEPKDKIRERIGRSPDKGDAAIMCLSAGTQAVARAMRRNAVMPGQGRTPVINLGHAAMKARR